MIVPASLSETLLFTTVRIHTRLVAGGEGTGTGFFFHFRVDETTAIPAVVTNKHVVQGAESGIFHVHEGRDGKPTDLSFPVMLDQFEQRWIPHPSPSVDLCAIPCGPIAQRFGGSMFYLGFDDSAVPTTEGLGKLAAAESVLMVGYPNGLWDDTNNLPLLRRGITASHPAIDFKGRPEMMVDIACFPGSSGSPVVIVDDGGHWNKFGHLVGGNGRLMLLGVLYAGPVMTQEGEIVVEPVPTQLAAKARTTLMIHLGYLIKAREILRLGEHVVSTLRGLNEIPANAQRLR